LVIVNPDDWRGFWNLPLLVELGIQLPQGIHGGVGEQLVHLGVRLGHKNKQTNINKPTKIQTVN
jgi:hypothetical protein